MKKLKTKFKDLFVVNTKIFKDNRGWLKEEFKKKFIKKNLVFTLVSSSKKNVLRGLHMQIKKPQYFERFDLRLTVDNPEDLVVCRHVYQNFKHLAPKIPLKDIISYLDKNPHLIKLIQPFTEKGYSTMYIWKSDEK